MSPDGAHGKAYGHLTWKGQRRGEDREQEIRGPLKKLWTLVGHTSSSPIVVESPAAVKLRQELAAAAPPPPPPQESTIKEELPAETDTAEGGGTSPQKQD